MRLRALVLALVAPLVLLLALGGLTAFMGARIEARYPPWGTFVGVTGGRLHYVEAGPRDRAPAGTIVFLHGASSNSADPMLSLGHKLAERYRIIALDRPGHGWSERIAGAEAALPARQAAIVAEALRKLGVGRAVMVGHSWAGSVLPNLALDHPDVTGGLVLISGVTHPWPGKAISWYYHPATSFVGWLFTRTITTPFGALVLEPALDGVFAPQAPPPNYAEAAKVPLVLRPASFQANAQDVAGLHAAVSAQVARYPQIRVPSVAIGGTDDTVVSTEQHARAFAREAPGARLVVLPGVGHMPHHSHGDLIRAEIEAIAAQADSRVQARGP